MLKSREQYEAEATVMIEQIKGISERVAQCTKTLNAIKAHLLAYDSPAIQELLLLIEECHCQQKTNNARP